MSRKPELVPEDSLHIRTASAAETEALGGLLLPSIPDAGVIAFHGDLAAGKTCFIRGLTRAAGCPEPFSSPTFTLINEYHGERNFHHMDLYRISIDEVVDLGYEEFFDPTEGISLIEWAERAAPLLPARRLDVKLEHGGQDIRDIRFENHGLLKPGWQDALVPRAHSD